MIACARSELSQSFGSSESAVSSSSRGSAWSQSKMPPLKLETVLDQAGEIGNFGAH
jgi:hypothetical protein